MKIGKRRVTLTIDKSASTVVLQIGQAVSVMSIGEWSKLIANPATSDRVIKECV
jgi:hypothetical protein